MIDKGVSMKWLNRHWLVGLALLLLVGGAHADQGGDADLEYQVRSGDTLWSIAEHYYGDPEAWTRISEVNGISIPRRLRPGEVLRIVPPRNFPGSVEYLTGSVWLIGDTDHRALRVGDLVPAGASLKSGPGAFLTLRFVNGARIVLPSNSRVRLDEHEGGGGVKVMLLEGGVESRVPKQVWPVRQSFDVSTPSGNLGVRGTHFSVAYPGDASTSASVLEGLVDASFDKNQADVDAGQGVWASVDGGFGVVDLLPSPRLRSSGAGEEDALMLMLSNVEGASSYRAQLATDPEFFDIVRDQTSVDGRFDFKALDNGFYHARLTALDNHDVEGLPKSELLFHRPVGVDVEYRQGEWIFRWDRQPKANYRLQLSADPGFETLAVDQPFQNSAGGRIPHLEVGEYYWRLMVTPAGADSSHLAGSGRLNAEARH
jgi:hypothetical protein